MPKILNERKVFEAQKFVLEFVVIQTGNKNQLPIEKCDILDKTDHHLLVAFNNDTNSNLIEVILSRFHRFF